MGSKVAQLHGLAAVLATLELDNALIQIKATKVIGIDLTVIYFNNITENTLKCMVTLTEISSFVKKFGILVYLYSNGCNSTPKLGQTLPCTTQAHNAQTAMFELDALIGVKYLKEQTVVLKAYHVLVNIVLGDFPWFG